MFPTVYDGAIIQKLAPANPNNPRGLRTFEQHFDRLPVQATDYYRFAGEEFGGHFHKGEDPSKDPELFKLISGKMEFCFYDKHQGRRVVTIDATDHVPVLLIIKPYLLHYANAITDVIFSEFRVTPFDPAHSDTFPAAEFSRLFTIYKIGLTQEAVSDINQFSSTAQGVQHVSS